MDAGGVVLVDDRLICGAWTGESQRKQPLPPFEACWRSVRACIRSFVRSFVRC